MTAQHILEYRLPLPQDRRLGNVVVSISGKGKDVAAVYDGSSGVATCLRPLYRHPSASMGESLQRAMGFRSPS